MKFNASLSYLKKSCLSISYCVQCHRGYLSVIEDYAPEVTKKFGKALVYVMTAGVFTALMYLNVKDVGICAAVKAIWSL